MLAVPKLQLDVLYKARGQELRGKARTGLTPMLRMVQVAGRNGTETPRCLEMVLLCLSDELWVTELPSSGSFPAYSYKLQPYHAMPIAPPPRQESGASGNKTPVSSVMVNVTLYSNRTEDDAGYQAVNLHPLPSLPDESFSEDEISV